MSITITELEMSLDASNKSNAQLQNTCKVQNEKIMQLASAYEDVNRKLGASVQQYEVTIKKLTELDVSYKKITADYNKSLTVIKDYEHRAQRIRETEQDLQAARMIRAQERVRSAISSTSIPLQDGEEEGGEGRTGF